MVVAHFVSVLVVAGRTAAVAAVMFVLVVALLQAWSVLLPLQQPSFQRARWPRLAFPESPSLAQPFSAHPPAACLLPPTAMLLIVLHGVRAIVYSPLHALGLGFAGMLQASDGPAPELGRASFRLLRGQLGECELSLRPSGFAWLGIVRRGE